MNEGFGELYTRLYNEYIEELEALRAESKKATKKMITLFVVIAILCFLMPFVAPFLIIGVITVAVINALRGKVSKGQKAIQDYKTAFKSKIMAPLVSSVFDNGMYEPEKGWTRHEYKQGLYRDHIDRYSSDDIETVIQFAEVHTEREHRDKDGHTSYSTIFHGLAGRMPLKKDISTNIFIRNNGGAGLFSKTKVKMDMSEFEKIFDVEAEDSILAVRILTADVMTEMIDLYNKFKFTLLKLNIKYFNDIIFLDLIFYGRKMLK